MIPKLQAENPLIVSGMGGKLNHLVFLRGLRGWECWMAEIHQ